MRRALMQIRTKLPMRQAGSNADVKLKGLAGGDFRVASKPVIPAPWKPSLASPPTPQAPNASFFDKYRRHLLVFGACTLSSIWIGASFGGSVPVSELLRNMSLHMQLLDSLDQDKLLKFAELLEKATWDNDEIKFRVLSERKYMEKLIYLSSANEAYTPEISGRAAKILENVSSCAALQEQFMREGFHVPILALLDADDCYLFVKKSLSAVISNLAQHAPGRVALVESGAVGVLHKVNSNQHIYRQQTKRAMQLLAVAFQDANLSAVLSANELELIRTEAANFALEKNTLFFQMENKLVESGVLLYFHTALGGAMWGTAVSVYQKLPLKAAVSSILRTSFITGMLPAYFVGLSVTLFQHMHRSATTKEEYFALYTGASLFTMYPWWYLMPVVERFCPLWLGGHVVGFLNFFFYMQYHNADIFKSDYTLNNIDSQSERAELARMKLLLAQKQEAKRLLLAEEGKK